MKRPLLALLFTCACGNAEIVAPGPLLVVDTHPGNGAVVSAGSQPIVVIFSEEVVIEQLEAAVTVEETTAQGTPIRALPLTLDSYDPDTFTAVFSTEPLEADAAYALTIEQAELRAASGAQLLTDLLRRFSAR